MSHWIVDGQKLTDEQYEELELQKRLEKQRIQEESDRLSRQLSQAYAALKEHLGRHPDVGQKIADERALEQQIYYNLRQNLHRADAAPRCVWIHEGGTVCKSPRMKNDIHCYAHYQMRHARSEKLWLPALTDANAIQLAVMLVQRAMLDGEITEKMAGLLLYSIQIAAANVAKTTFGQANEQMVTEIRPEDDVMAEHKERMEKLKRIEEAKTGEKTSPRINTDQTDQFGKENLPLIHTEDTDKRSGDRVIGASGDRKSNTEALTADEGGLGKDLPLIHTENTDKRSGDRVIGASGDRKSNTEALTADEGGSEPAGLSRMNTEDNDLNGGIGKILPQSVGSGAEVYANRGQNGEVQANLG
jgi:hypothetical protein